MIKLEKTVPKLLIACYEDDVLANAAERLAAEILMKDTGLSHTWRKQSGCTIGTVETACPTNYPIFVSGPLGFEFSALEGRNGCVSGAGILLMSWNSEGELRSEAPRRHLRPGRLRQPIAGMRKIILISSDERYAGNRKTLLSSVADAIIGAVVSPDYGRSVLFVRELRQHRVAQETAAVEASAASA
jgi:hypothetical protein